MSHLTVSFRFSAGTSDQGHGGGQLHRRVLLQLAQGQGHVVAEGHPEEGPAGEPVRAAATPLPGRRSIL